MTTHQDIVIILHIDIAGMNAGDRAIMRPNLGQPAPITIPAVLVQYPGNATDLLIEYDPEGIKREGLKVTHYAVGHFPAPRPVFGVLG